MRRICVAFLASWVMRSGLKGFSMKSMAPRRIASTAMGTSPWPVIMMTGRLLSSCIRRLRNAIPSMPGMRMSLTTTPGQSGPITFSASSALAGTTTPPTLVESWVLPAGAASNNTAAKTKIHRRND